MPNSFAKYWENIIQNITLYFTVCFFIKIMFLAYWLHYGFNVEKNRYGIYWNGYYFCSSTTQFQFFALGMCETHTVVLFASHLRILKDWPIASLNCVYFLGRTYSLFSLRSQAPLDLPRLVGSEPNWHNWRATSERNSTWVLSWPARPFSTLVE